MPGEATWSLPVYELAMMAAADLRARGVDARHAGHRHARARAAPSSSALRPAPRCARCSTPAASRSGPAPGRWPLRDGLLARRAGPAAARRRGDQRAELEGPALAGLPADARGFIPVDAHGRVAGAPGVYAAGDATTFPVKQGGLATQQADAVAEAVAADLGLVPDPAPFRPVLRGLLLTGGAPLYLRAELGGDREPTARTLRGEVSGRALWWPPGKVAGRYLAPYLGTARPVDLGSEPLRDRAAAAGASPAADRDEAYQLALLLAEEDAKFGDYRQALHALDAAAALAGGVLPDRVGREPRALAARARAARLAELAAPWIDPGVSGARWPGVRRNRPPSRYAWEPAAILRPAADDGGTASRRRFEVPIEPGSESP